LRFPSLHIIPPDNFGKDWWRWANSQTAHVFVGIGLVFVTVMVFFGITGELPYRTHVLVTIFIGYAAFKLFLQGWYMGETIEDIVFVVGYGAAGALYGSYELTSGGAKFVTDPVMMLPFFYVYAAHIIALATYRRFIL